MPRHMCTEVADSADSSDSCAKGCHIGTDPLVLVWSIPNEYPFVVRNNWSAQKGAWGD
jgi:hypothetical protein